MVSERLAGLTSWHSDWTGLRVAVLGLSVTGFSVADTLTELGAEVLVLSEDASEEYARLVPVIGARLELGSLAEVPDALREFAPEVVVASPGFPPAHPVIAWAHETGIALWGDVELAWRVRDKVPRPDGTPAEWMLITGTNGKTTTTQLTATLLNAGGLRAAPCGNIGIPVLDAVRDPAGFDVLVVELSSHQLWYIGQSEPAGQLVPYASTCLNLADDHLVWHGGAEAYRAAKAVVYRNTKIACVYNKSDRATLRMVEEADVTEGARAVGFDLGTPGPSDLGVVDGILVDRAFHDDRRHSALELTTTDALRDVGLSAPHVVQNILAASALARSAGVEPVAIRDALAEFRMDAHRIQLVAEHRGIRWIDDSKATNPHAAASSLRAHPGAVWIVGGDLKGVDLGALIAEAGGIAGGAIVIGADREPVLAAFRRHAPHVPVQEVVPADTGEIMDRVVRIASGMVDGAGTVLLAPAAASFDQFVSYADRGERFARAVREWIGQGSADDADGSPSAR
ncbi:UDP-N-acetylmuramoyl-L-alanine--D-glutamate ligase [Microbacterium sp. ARD32]|uniref:UDP-N-acetylmuramoyl-L-alanine--D-glutamate ligase n=1 Tax=Microbacterium sp. ARD32 TaxID=2962577 RepID=UPI0028826C92|nr:UDP-N-acetylmuramoyl-L-alanine--D-glutamate ligase [Microbacterium sp. ARD32]MDT0157535.1 UDP-N-acetylmuramoyl-L-alanine--D-glutamate ligase [Microbacterium sp. ARD32]